MSVTARVILQGIKKLETEALIVGFHEDVRPLKGLAGELDWLLCGALSRLILKNKLRGALGEVALLTSRGKVPARKIFMVGLGPKAGFSLASLRSAAETAAGSARGAGVRNAAMEYFPLADESPDRVASAFQEGVSRGAAGGALDVFLLAPDADAYKKLSSLIKG
ncbi:MAG TPA: M17 family peptidase N-terminal domain-containing protein [Nitrospirota bacterium]